MRVIDDKQLIRGIWGHHDPEKNCSCPADTKSYVVPGKPNKAFAQTCILPDAFKQQPDTFCSLHHPEAWREHRDAQPVVVRLLDKTLPGYGPMYVFYDDQELAKWLTHYRAILVERGEQEIPDELAECSKIERRELHH